MPPKGFSMMNATLTWMCNLGLAAAVGLALPLSATAPEDRAGTEPASFHTQLMQQLREFQYRSQQREWVNRWAPGVRVSVPESADRRPQTIVTGYTRAALDRGGWANPWVSGDAYAAGAPLLAVTVGSGLTSLGEPQRAAVPLLAAR